MREFLQQTSIKKILRYMLLGFLSLVVQNMLFTQFKLFGVCPMILPAVVVAVGMFEGVGYGVVFGLIVGFFADMAYIENTVLFTILFPALGFFSSFVCVFFINKRFVAFLFLALTASAVTAIFQMINCMLSDEFSFLMVKNAILQTVISLPFSAAAFPLPDMWNRE